MTRVAFKIANTDTPTSANTASHIVAIPNAPRVKKMALTPNAKIIFCHTIFFVKLEISMAFAI